MPKIDLLPCPFCGKIETLKMLSFQTEKHNFFRRVVCSTVEGGCGASTIWNCATPEEAAKEWNARASGWIPCGEKKPNEDSYRWAVGITSTGRCIAFQEHNAYENDTGGISVPTYLAHGSEITHWMPTPELPKEVHHDEN